MDFEEGKSGYLEDDAVEDAQSPERDKQPTKKVAYMALRLPSGTPLVISDSLDQMQQSFNHSKTPYHTNFDVLFCIVDIAAGNCTYYRRHRFQPKILIPSEITDIGKSDEEIIHFYETTNVGVPVRPSQRRRETAGKSAEISQRTSETILGQLDGPTWGHHFFAKKRLQ